MEFIKLPNSDYSYLLAKLPRILKQELKAQALELLTQYEIDNDVNTESLIRFDNNNFSNFVIDMVYEFYQTTNFNISLNLIWINYMHRDRHVQLHRHAGNVSFTCWLNIPFSIGQGDFEFEYMDKNKNIRKYPLKLSNKSEGSIIMFNSKLQHRVHPFTESSQYRISLAGDITVTEISDLGSYN